MTQDEQDRLDAERYRHLRDRRARTYSLDMSGNARYVVDSIGLRGRSFDEAVDNDRNGIR